MGRTSSKTKSSRKNSSKLQSEARKKKKNKTTKSKKLSSRKDYFSSSSDGSKSLVSISTFSSEEEHYRSRSRRKGELKGSKKRARDKSAKKSDKVSKNKKPNKKKLRREPSFTSLSSDSADRDPDTNKKLRKKRRRREPSIDSITSDYSSDENREVERRRGRFREKSEVERDLGETKRLKARSRSYSPYDRCEDEIENSVPIIPAENNFRRLRSVITVLKPEEDEEIDLIQDVRREDIEHDHSLKRDEDLVSEFKMSEVSRGDDGEVNGVGIENPREEVSPVLRKTENDLESILRLKALENMIKFKGAQIEKLKAPTKLRNSNVENRDEVEKLKAPNKLSNNAEEQSRIKSEPITIPKKTQKANFEVDKNVVNENSKVKSESVPIASKNGGVVESPVSEPSNISKKIQNTNFLFSESNVDKKTSIPSERVSIASKNVGEFKSSIPETSIIPKKSQSANSLLAESNVDNRVAARTSETAEQARKDVKCNSVLRSSISDRIKNILEKSRDTKSSVAESTVNNKATLTSAISGEASKKDEKYNNAPKFSISESSSSRKPPLEENISKEHENTDRDDTKSYVVESTVNYKANLTSAISGEASKKDEKDNNNVPKYSISEPSSSRKPPLEENISKEHENSDKDGSQFEQKTMSVMRGGEMVQVSYKVYIPKKAPALARRPLMRK